MRARLSTASRSSSPSTDTCGRRWVCSSLMLASSDFMRTNVGQIRSSGNALSQCAALYIHAV